MTAQYTLDSMDKSSASTYYGDRLKKLQAKLKKNNLNGVVLVPGSNLKYYTGGESLLLERLFLLFVQDNGEPHLIAPDFECGQYRDGAIRIVLHEWKDNEGPSAALRELSEQLGMKGRWGVEGRVPFRFLNSLRNYINPEWVDAEPILQSIREIKEEQEIDLLKRAASILAKSFLKIPDMLTAGMSEMELSRKLTQEIYTNEAELVEVVLVQSGERGAAPHSLPSSRKISTHEPVVIDVASTYAGYYADITRTVAIGRGSKHFEDFYSKVLEAQKMAIEASKPDVTVGTVDAAAREYLKQQKLGDYFVSRTGHGLGLEVHETPYIAAGRNEVLRSGMVYTVEPGVYIPNEMGIRIEDDVLLTENSHQVITSTAPKEFGWWS